MATTQHTLLTATASLASVGDPEGTRTVTSIIALLVALGLALVLLAIWLRRATRPDPELLAPLEAMGERRWRRRDPVWQRRRLDELRPTGAEPLEPSVAPPDIDEAFDHGPAASGFDDLHGPDEPDEVEADDDPARLAALAIGQQLAPPPSGALPADAPTPPAAERPSLVELGGDLDPEVLAKAMADLDAELADDHGDESADTPD